ncbi:MAG: hypothetical protein ABFE16_08145 [Armatimonadia bacterium]
MILAAGASLVTVAGARVRPGATTTGGSAPDSTTTPGNPASGAEAVEVKGLMVTAGICGPLAVGETALGRDVMTPGRASRGSARPVEVAVGPDTTARAIVVGPGAGSVASVGAGPSVRVVRVKPAAQTDETVARQPNTAHNRKGW